MLGSGGVGRRGRRTFEPMPIAAPARCGCRWSSMHRHGPVRADLPLTAAVAAAVAGSAGAAAGSAPGLGLVAARGPDPGLQSVLGWRSEEHTSELQSLIRISYAVFCLKKKNIKQHT